MDIPTVRPVIAADANAEAPALLKLLAHDLRWHLLSVLSRGDRRVQELLQLSGEPANLVSYHLRQLRDFQLVTEHRSAADGRDVYYSLDLPRLHALYSAAGMALHPALRSVPESLLTPALPPLPGDPQSSTAPRLPTPYEEAMPSQASRHGPVQVLFLCTHNSARSQMAEAILRTLGGDRVVVSSAGSEPTTVHPDAIRVLSQLGIDIGSQRSKHLDEFRGQTFDYVITLCDHVREVCPIFSGEPGRIHWSFPDPTAVPVEGDARTHAFTRTALQLFTRVRYLLPVIAQEHNMAA